MIVFTYLNMLDKKNRITKQKEFDQFFGKEFKQKKGQNVAGKFVILKCFDNETEDTRFAFVVSNKVDKRATHRNKIRRQLRSIIRDNASCLKKGKDCLIIIKPSIKDKEFIDVEKEFTLLLKKVKLI
jgi:ribonuclease P protein component